MDKKIKILLIFIIAIAVLVGLIILGQQPPTQEEQIEKETPQEKKTSAQEYPLNLIEGLIKEIDLEQKTIKIEADTSKIKTAEKDVMEKSIKFTESTEWVVFNAKSNEELSLKKEELKIDDGIVVIIKESTYDKVNELNEFTAMRITKIIVAE